MPTAAIAAPEFAGLVFGRFIYWIYKEWDIYPSVSVLFHLTNDFGHFRVNQNFVRRF